MSRIEHRDRLQCAAGMAYRATGQLRKTRERAAKLGRHAVGMIRRQDQHVAADEA